MSSCTRTIGGILLVSGTTIGAAMLALPVSTGMGGFFPAAALFVIYGLLMTYTAFLFLEANLWLGGGANLSSMVRHTLGKEGHVLSWLLYLFLLYSLMTAYIAGCGAIVTDAVFSLTGKEIPQWGGAIPLLVVLGSFIFHGHRSVDLINRILMFGLVVAFVWMAVDLVPHVEPQRLAHADLGYVWLGVSVIATSFGCHIVIPSLVTYLDGDVKKLKRVLLIGGLVPLAFYLIWEYVALGIIPVEGPDGLIEGYIKGSNGVHLLTAALGHSRIAFIAQLFSFFAIVTSFLGVSLSLFDFLADGLHIEKTIKGRCWLFLLTFVPPLLIALYNARAFLTALEYAGAFGVMTLLALIPALMVWSGRYIKHLDQRAPFRAPGGKFALIVVMVLALVVVVTEVGVKLYAQNPQELVKNHE